jgi:AcrR family transcriptional regulator
MPTTRTRPTRAETRDRILSAAGEVFASRGYDGASLDQVAAAAGLTKGAVYSSFSGKDELFYALVAARLDQRLALVADAADGERDLAELLSDAEDDLARLFTTQHDWHLLFIECWTRAVRDPRRRAEWARQRRAAQAVIADFFERHAAATGATLPAPAAELALAAMALSNGLAMEHIADPDAVDAGLFSRMLGLLVTR